MNLIRPSYAQGFARNAAESAYPELWRGLVGLWPTSLGPTGLTLYDRSLGVPNNGGLTNMEAGDWVLSGASRPAGYVLDYDADNDRVNCGDVLAFNEVLFTVVFWVRLNGLGAHNTVFSKENLISNAQGIPVWLFVFNATGLLDMGCGNGVDFSQLKGTTALEVDTWYHVAFVRNDNSGAIYLNSVQEPTTGSVISGTVANVYPILIGARRNTDFPNTIDGMMGDTMLYNRILSGNEIADMFAGAHPLTPKRPLVGFVPAAPAEYVPQAIMVL